MPGARRQSRSQVVLPVRVSGFDASGRIFNVKASTADVSATGARLAGVDAALQAGDYVRVQCGTETGRFRIVWIKPGVQGSEVGLAQLPGGKPIWNGVVLNSETGTYVDNFDFNKKERRRHRRFSCELGIEFAAADSSAAATRAQCSDIGLGGCYIETWWPLPIATKLKFKIVAECGTIAGEACVCTCHPRMGMGVRFTRIEPVELLAVLIDRVSSSLKGTQPQSAANDSAPVNSGSAPVQKVPDNTPQATTPSPSPRVLLADDSVFLRNAHTLFLRRHGFQVTAVEDGEQALAAVQGSNPDVIVLDLLMPKLGGVEALKRLKSNPETASIPVVIATGLAATNQDRLLKEGAAAFFSKTTQSPEQLPEFIAMVLAKHARPQTPPLSPGVYPVLTSP